MTLHTFGSIRSKFIITASTICLCRSTSGHTSVSSTIILAGQISPFQDDHLLFYAEAMGTVLIVTECCSAMKI